jgi:AcrR family transcriptional regulator
VSDPGAPRPAPRGRPPKDAAAPRGRDQVYAATIRAATALFAQRGIAAVSVREVATRAGVNPALVHRYVGGKQVLLKLVLTSLTDAMRSDLDTVAANHVPMLPPLSAQALATYELIAAHIVIEGLDIRDYQSDFPVIRRVIEEIEHRTGVDSRTARCRGAQIFALDLAVRLFEPVLLRAAGLTDDDADDLHLRMRELQVGIGEL